MRKSKISLFHFPSHVVINIACCLLGAALITELAPEYQRAFDGLSMVLLAICNLLWSLTTHYYCSVHNYLADYLYPLVERTRTEGNALRISITDSVVSRFIGALDGLMLLVIGMNFAAKTYFPEVEHAAAAAFWGGALIYTAGFYAIRHNVAKRILRAGWVAKARPMGKS